MSDRVHPAFRKLFGLAAAPGRALSTLEPESRRLPRLDPELGSLESGVLERLAPLLTPASVATRLERALAKLGPEEAEGDGGASRLGVRRGTETGGVGTATRSREASVGGSDLLSPGPRELGAPRRPLPRDTQAKATPDSPRPERFMPAPARGVDSRKLHELAGLGAEPPVAGASRVEHDVDSRRHQALAGPGAEEPAGLRTRPGASRQAGRTGPRVPSREEVRARLEQRARRAGAADALETPVVSLLQDSAREVADVLSRSLGSPEQTRGKEASRASSPGESLMGPLERALEKLDARGPVRSAAPNAVAGGAPAARGGLAGLAARAEEARGGLSGLAGLAARASSGVTSPARARTESHPPPPLLANTALPSPAVPSVLAERMEEAKLSQRLERLLRREAERAGVSLEGLDP